MLECISMPLIWLLLLIAFIVLEALTAQMVSLWFIIGAAAALISSLLHAQLWLQVVLFVGISVLVLVTLRPILIKKFGSQKVATNADMVLGKTAVVISDIDNVTGKGRVAVNGLDWAAVSDSGKRIKTGTEVTVQSLSGVTLTVKPLKEKD